jgi:hypothetical protein
MIVKDECASSTWPVDARGPDEQRHRGGAGLGQPARPVLASGQPGDEHAGKRQREVDDVVLRHAADVARDQPRHILQRDYPDLARWPSSRTSIADCTSTILPDDSNGVNNQCSPIIDPKCRDC